MLLSVYKTLISHSKPALNALLKRRLTRGKEHESRWVEKKANITRPRPAGSVIWLHAASVGEAQSALILIEKICTSYPNVHLLITSGTLTSAQMLEKRLPEQAFHQFAPLDHPDWVRSFLEHWQPDLVLWMESELWPNILMTIKEKEIPAILLNARLSPTSFSKWRLFKSTAKKVLSTFDLILCQTMNDVNYYQSLGAKNVEMSGNLKYSAAPLPYKEKEYADLQNVLKERPVWLYASTHASEEDLAVRLHLKLKKSIPSLLTIIVPRHPDRGAKLEQDLAEYDVRITRRTNNYRLPDDKTDIYLCDTLGELGLFYRLSPIAVIGRSFSDDGGGGHNPIEAAQLNCAILHGPYVQNLQKIYDEMAYVQSTVQVNTEEEFYNSLHLYLSNKDVLKKAQVHAHNFCEQQDHILEVVWDRITPYLENLKDKEAA